MGSDAAPAGAGRAPSAWLATAGNALSQAARPVVLLVCGIAYGPAVVGQLATAFGLAVLATVACYPSLGFAVLRHRGGVPLNQGLLRRMAFGLLVGTLLVAALVVADAWTLRLAAQVRLDPVWLAWAVVLAPVTVAEQYAQGLCSVGGALDRYSTAMLASRIGLLAASVAAAALHADPLWLLALAALGSLAVVARTATVLGPLPPGRSPRGLLRDGLAAAPNAWAWFLMAQGAILLIQAFMGPHEAGLFTLAYLLLNLPVLALQGVSMAWMALAARHGPGDEWRRTRRLVPKLLLAHVACIALLALAGEPVWTALFGPGLAPVFALLRAMAWGAPGFALAYLLLPQWTARGWFLRLSATYMALALAYLAAVAAAAQAQRLDLAAYATAGLGLGLAAANLWAARHWDRAPAAAPGAEPANGVGSE
ncbi:MAG: hypothetical protein LC623_08190 [Halobacteriales archaeon]|nr:hypothetical protein [Halobacteriales archaeon]